MRLILTGLAFVGIILVYGDITLAHPGNTASDGCHYCRTNCDKWGEEWNERHCHRSKTLPSNTRSYQKDEPTENIDNTWKYVVGTGIVGIVGYFMGKKK